MLKFIYIILAFVLGSIWLSCNSQQHPFSSKEVGLYPVPTGWINDYEKLFSPSETMMLDSIVRQHEKATFNEIAIITLSVNPFDNITIDSFATNLFNIWEIGKEKENNGVLILVSANSRQVVIRNGYGIEKIFTNTETKQIIDNSMIPEYKNGNYYKGTLNGLLAIIEKIK